ncbi:MAG: T9SS type A sorting domain-containing protein [Bacteroidia bacterium]
MRKEITLLFMLVCGFSGFAQRGYTTGNSVTTTGQDTLLFQSFNYTNFSFDTTMPPGHNFDTAWYAYDNAFLIDGSGSTSPRPGHWFRSYTFWKGDSANFLITMASNSWFNPAGTADDWLITPSIYISDTTAKFSWRSATRQTPYYLDGYEIRCSAAGTNSLSSFHDTLFTAGEYLSRVTPLADSSYGPYTFSKGWVQGANHTYIACSVPHCDSSRFYGELAPHTVSLKAYAGKTIFLAVHHNSHDDNLISVDNLLVTGTGVMGINEHVHAMELNVFPNPSYGDFQLNYTLPTSSSVMVSIYDMSGKLVKAKSMGLQAEGSQTLNINLSELSAGHYSLVMQTAAGKSTAHLILKK